MFAVEVSDHIMVAHSLSGEQFGPAQRMHGATFVVSVAFFREKLGRDHVVVDIGRAGELLKTVLAPLNYANLDELFPNEITTAEFLCRHIFHGVAIAVMADALGPSAEEQVERIRVTLQETPNARAWFEGRLADA